MFKTYFIIATRNLPRKKGYTTINVSGLAIGIAACFLLFIVVKYELSYDKFQPNYNRIYHVASTYKKSESLSFGEGIPYPAYDALPVQFTDVSTAVMFSNYYAQVAVPVAPQ